MLSENVKMLSKNGQSIFKYYSQSNEAWNGSKASFRGIKVHLWQ